MAVRDDFSAGEVLAAADLNDTFAAKGDISTNGAWTFYTPGTINLTVGNGSLTGEYVKVGKLVHGRVELTFGTTTSFSGQVVINTPTTPSGSISGTGLAQETGVQGLPVRFDTLGGGMYVRALGASSTYVNNVGVTATVPFTWANTDVLYLEFWYEEA